ncbi:MAG: ASKHA domain-containing protein [Clostridiales bacterium]|nr:ASKHA domain-containing protein [Clostridiales bacterium]
MKLIILDQNRVIEVPAGTNLLEALRENGLHPDAPCGGRGKCGKCKVMADGAEKLACQTVVDRDMMLSLPHQDSARILTDAQTADVTPDGANRYCIAFDLGTTTVVAYLMDGTTGKLLSKTSCMNPQAQFGADVISRIEYAMEGHAKELSGCIREALSELTQTAAKQAGISPADITAASIVGNTAMHHLLLEIDPKPLTVPPYMPNVSEGLTLSPAGLLPISPDGTVRILPNIAGFVGADTVGCLLATRLDTLDDLTLMIDIGTNGEMVLGNKNRRIACSTAAGPAFEGAKIECGMRGAPGAVDHVTVENGKLRFHVIGEGEAVGLCGSGLLDLIAALLETGEISESGRMESGKTYQLEGTRVYLTQKDVREVQLAKAAIRAGIELMCKRMGVRVEDIRQVLLAGAFGNYLDPNSACTIGMIPPALRERIVPIGNAAGEGAKMAVLSAEEYACSKRLARETEFLELASMPEFNDCYVDCLCFEEE